jgi:hypothetical protein
MKQILAGKKVRTFLAKFFLLRYKVPLLVTARVLMGESGMFRTQMGK